MGPDSAEDCGHHHRDDELNTQHRHDGYLQPAEILGYEVGEWHATHDQLVYFMKEMARISDRITIKETGRTYENRPLLLLTITHPDNHQKIEEIKGIG